MMGLMFSQQCDLCPKLQTEDSPAKIQGTMFTMNGVSKFACGECRGILDAAFAVGAQGLREPMKALAEVTKERDQLLRLLKQSGIQREEGTVSLVGVEVDHLRAQAFNNRFQPEGRALGHVGQITKKLDYKPEKPAKKKR
jgi:hypothetical protein